MVIPDHPGGAGQSRRIGVVAFIPDEDAVKRLVSTVLPEHNDAWAVQRRYMTLETRAGRTDEQPATLTHIAA